MVLLYVKIWMICMPVMWQREKNISMYENKLEEMGKKSRETRSSKLERDFLKRELAEYKRSTFVVEKTR